MLCPPRRPYRAALAVLASTAVLAWAGSAGAATFGVPTNLNASGATTGTSVNPPGWFILDGTASANSDGDTVHQLRLFIEVTGTTLDIMVFDPGNSGARDLVRGGDSRTTFQLRDPCTPFPTCTGALRNQVPDFDNDSATTDNRLVRFVPGAAAFFALDSPSASNVSFSGLNPGLYEFRITMVNGEDDINFFGVDVRVARGNPAHYNVFTIGESTAPDTSMMIGANELSGGVDATVTRPMFFYPYVPRGCTVQTSNYDMDAVAGGFGQGATGSITDVLGATTALTMSGVAVHSENTITVENAGATNLDAINYGMYTLVNDPGTCPAGTCGAAVQINFIDWRVADFTPAPPATAPWNDNPAALPRDPINAIRTYLPNGYTCAAGPPSTCTPNPAAPNPPVNPPPEPILAASARVVSGANPPAANLVTRYLITATVDNCAVRNAVDATICDLPSAATTNVQITIPELPDIAGVVTYTYVAGSQAGFVNGVAAACTDGSGAGFRRCTFATLAGGSAATLNVEMDVTPEVTGLRDLTGPPAVGAPPPNTTVWAQYTPASNSGAFPRTETLGPLCNLVVNVGGGALPTRATLRGLRVDAGAGVVEFATGSQRESVAFDVYATRDRTGRGRRALLARIPVRAPVRNSLTPVLYRAETRPFAAPYLLIEEIDARGRRHVMGPFEVGDLHLRDALGAIEGKLDEAGAAPGGAIRWVSGWQSGRLAGTRHRPAQSPTPSLATPQGVRIEVAQAGLVNVSLDDLEPLGLPPGTAVKSVRLTNQGQDVAFRDVGVGRQIEFQSQALSTDYTGRNAYVLSWQGRVPGLEVPLTRSGDPPDPAFVRVEQNSIYVANAPEDADPWVWDLLIGDKSTWPYGSPAEGRFDLPSLPPGATGPVPIRIRLVGRTQHLHKVTAAINGAPVGQLTFEGPVSALLTGSVSGQVLQPTGNQLTLTYTATPEDPNDVGLLYLSQLDVGLPAAPPLVVAPVERLSVYDPVLPPLGGVDYLIVTHPLFGAQADRIAAAKQAEGHTVVVVDVERVYDRFSAGLVEARAVQTLIRSAWTQGALRYVLLLGGDTFDTHDYLGTGAATFVPSLLAWDGEFGRVPSENRYADVDGDGTPDLAIGRLPVRTVAEADVLADKIEGAASALAVVAGRHLFGVDNQGAGDVSFRHEATTVAMNLPQGSSVTWADVADGIGPARAALLLGLQQGALATHYFGHAGPEVWADEGLLTVDDVAALQGSGRETVVFAWACEAQWYQNLFGPSVNEALLLVPNGGALAAFGPAGATDPTLQRRLYSWVYAPWLESGVTLGEAIRRAKVRSLAQGPESRPVVEGWNLLGDPALAAPAASVRRR